MSLIGFNGGLAQLVSTDMEYMTERQRLEMPTVVPMRDDSVQSNHAGYILKNK